MKEKAVAGHRSLAASWAKKYNESLPQRVPANLSMAPAVEEIDDSLTLLSTEAGRQIANSEECLEEITLPLGVSPGALGGCHVDN